MRRMQKGPTRRNTCVDAHARTRAHGRMLAGSCQPASSATMQITASEEATKSQPHEKKARGSHHRQRLAAPTAPSPNQQSGRWRCPNPIYSLIVRHRCGLARSYNFRRGIDAAGHCPLSERLDDSSEAMMRVPPLSKIVWMLDRSEFGTYSVSSVAARPENVCPSEPSLAALTRVDVCHRAMDRTEPERATLVLSLVARVSHLARACHRCTSAMRRTFAR
jgi:hypothetical protein